MHKHLSLEIGNLMSSKPVMKVIVNCWATPFVEDPICTDKISSMVEFNPFVQQKTL